MACAQYKLFVTQQPPTGKSSDSRDDRVRQRRMLMQIAAQSRAQLAEYARIHAESMRMPCVQRERELLEDGANAGEKLAHAAV